MKLSASKQAKLLMYWYLSDTNSFTGNQERHAKEHARRCAIQAVLLVISTIPDDPNPFSGTNGIKTYWANVIKKIKEL